jgi:hypothetical protein
MVIEKELKADVLNCGLSDFKDFIIAIIEFLVKRS